jgi:hypothetical protein
VVQTLAQEVQKLFLTSLELEHKQNFGWIMWSFSKVCSLTTVWTSIRLKSNYYMDKYQVEIQLLYGQCIRLKSEITVCGKCIRLISDFCMEKCIMPIAMLKG